MPKNKTPCSGSLVVFSVRPSDKGDGSSVWLRAGTATQNNDGSIEISLDVLPMSGVLHVRRIHPADITR